MQKRERGQIIIIVALSVVALLALAALAVDGGQLYAEKRSAQSAADNAALASGYAICKGTDPIAPGFAVAAGNGYDNNGTTNTVVIHNPPSSGPHSGENEYTEALVDSTRSTFFAQLIGIDSLPVSARAVSRCRRSFDYAVIALNKSNTVHGIYVYGQGNITVNNGGMISDSTHPIESIYQECHGAGCGYIHAEEIHAVGGVTCTNCAPAPETHMQNVDDPLAALTPPADPGGACISLFHAEGELYPGKYCDISGEANKTIHLNPGIYWIAGPGGFFAGADSHITGENVMIYLSPSAGSSSLSGTTNVTISACSPASPGAWCVGALAKYAGMLFYSDSSESVSMTGNSYWDAVGTIYTPHAFLDLHGNAVVGNLSSMIVADKIAIGGDSAVTVNYIPGLNVQPPLSVSLVE